MKKEKIVSSRIKFGAFIGVLVMGGATYGDTITLRNAVRLQPGDDVVNLGDVATLQGTHAEALADLQIRPLTGSTPLELTVRDIRRALENAKIHWGLIELNGRRVIVRPARTAGEGGLIAMHAARLEQSTAETAPEEPAKQRDGVTADSMADQASVRGEVARYFTRTLHRPGAEITLGFDAADEEFLNLARSGHRIEIAPQSSMAGDRVTLAVRLWDETRITRERRLGIDVMLHTRVATPLRDVARKETISATDVRAETIWLPPTQAALAAPPSDVIGSVASRRLATNRHVRASAIQGRTLIRKGDLVIVRCLVGGTVISVAAEARDNGAAGELIEFRKRGERTTFLATVSATGDAIVDLSR